MDSFKDDRPRPVNKPSRIPWLSQRQQQLIAALLVAAHIGLLTWWSASGGFSGELISIDDAEHRPYQLQLDLNRCDWPDLTLLPGISETTARRIVSDRELNGPFANVDNLRRVHGIGPKKLAKLRPFLVCQAPRDQRRHKP